MAVTTKRTTSPSNRGRRTTRRASYRKAEKGEVTEHSPPHRCFACHESGNLEVCPVGPRVQKCYSKCEGMLCCHHSTSPCVACNEFYPHHNKNGRRHLRCKRCENANLRFRKRADFEQHRDWYKQKWGKWSHKDLNEYKASIQTKNGSSSKRNQLHQHNPNTVESMRLVHHNAANVQHHQPVDHYASVLVNNMPYQPDAEQMVQYPDWCIDQSYSDGTMPLMMNGKYDAKSTPHVDTSQNGQYPNNSWYMSQSSEVPSIGRRMAHLKQEHAANGDWESSQNFVFDPPSSQHRDESNFGPRPLHQSCMVAEGIGGQFQSLNRNLRGSTGQLRETATTDVEKPMTGTRRASLGLGLCINTSHASDQVGKKLISKKRRSVTSYGSADCRMVSIRQDNTTSSPLSCQSRKMLDRDDPDVVWRTEDPYVQAPSARRASHIEQPPALFSVEANEYAQPSGKVDQNDSHQEAVQHVEAQDRVLELVRNPSATFLGDVLESQPSFRMDSGISDENQNFTFIDDTNNDWFTDYLNGDEFGGSIAPTPAPVAVMPLDLPEKSPEVVSNGTHVTFMNANQQQGELVRHLDQEPPEQVGPTVAVNASATSSLSTNTVPDGARCSGTSIDAHSSASSVSSKSSANDSTNSMRASMAQVALHVQQSESSGVGVVA